RFESSHSDHTFSKLDDASAQVDRQVALLEAMRERVRKATGPDRDIDWAVFSTVEVPALAGSQWRVSLFVDLHGTPAGSDAVEWSEDGLRWFPAMNLARYTASVDAALARVGRMLPGSGWQCGTCCVSEDALIFLDFKQPEARRMPQARTQIRSYEVREPLRYRF
ncbi:MAG: hypothetical protein Q7T73_11215, partial [Beijerinckiaceae bacterium]|nr:hypothetical protein [Beijerinckiaceae bacterium]